MCLTPVAKEKTIMSYPVLLQPGSRQAHQPCSQRDRLSYTSKTSSHANAYGKQFRASYAHAHTRTHAHTHTHTHTQTTAYTHTAHIHQQAHTVYYARMALNEQCVPGARTSKCRPDRHMFDMRFHPSFLDSSGRQDMQANCDRTSSQLLLSSLQR